MRFSKFASKFGVEKLITSGVGLYIKLKNFLKKLVKSELNKKVQGHHKNSARNTSFSSNSSIPSFKIAARSPV